MYYYCHVMSVGRRSVGLSVGRAGVRAEVEVE